MPGKLVLDELKCRSLNYNYEGAGKLHFCFYKKEKNVIQQQTYFTSCRELMIDNLVYDMKDIDKNRLRILIAAVVNHTVSQKKVIKKIELGIKIANIVNSKYNMQPIVYNILDSNKIYPIIELSASKKWQRSPQMLSLFLLFIKFCNEDLFLKVNTFEELMTTLSKNISTVVVLDITTTKIITFLDNYEKLFKNLSMKTNYQSKTYQIKRYRIQYDGITKLFTNQSDHKILNKRFANLLPDE